MDTKLSQLLANLFREGLEHDAHTSDRRCMMLNLAPATAQLVNLFARCLRAKRILEIGTSNGYSTIWLAEAAAQTGGRVITIDRDADKQMLARENLRRSQLAGFVELRHGEAGKVIEGLEGPFDFVFFDADRISAPAQLKALLPKLAPRVLLLADNAVSHFDELVPYLQALEKLPDFDRQIVPVGKGLSVAFRDQESKGSAMPVW